MKPDWTELRQKIMADRGSYCWNCGIEPWTELHHIFLGRKKGCPEYDVLENLCPTCENRHVFLRNWEVRCRFWRSQCELYGRVRMQEWLDNLGLRYPPMFE